MTRRHELDWLRVLLFALLVPHHVAVGFVDWGVDIYRFVNNQLAGDGMTLFIYWSHSWRLPSLFMIAGIGTWFLTRRSLGPGFLPERLTRLLVPCLFGMFFLNVFSGFAMEKMAGLPPGFAMFWWQWLTAPKLGQVQHLWFLLNLAAYTVLCWPIFRFGEHLVSTPLSPPRLVLFLLVLSAVAVVLLKPHAAALTGDNYQFVFYLCFFAGGYVIGAQGAAMLDWCGRHAWKILILAILLFSVKVTLLTLALLDDPATGQALAEGGWRPLGLAPANATAFSVIEAATAWGWCIAALGLAVRYLGRPSAVLSRLNRAVFPVYVLHFPVTIVGLALVAQISLPWHVEFLGLLIFIYGVTWFFWMVFDRLGPAARLVGGKPQGAAGRAER